MLSLDAVPEPLEGDASLHHASAGLQAREPAQAGEHDSARADLAKVMQELTPLQRQLCALVGGEGLPLAEVGARLGMPRSNVYEEFKRLRKVFEAHGLHHYLRG